MWLHSSSTRPCERSTILEKQFQTMQELTRHIDQVRTLCLSAKVRSLFAFGSVMEDRLRADSDIDLAVDIDEADPLSYSDHYFNLKFSLQKLLKRPIDLLELNAVINLVLRKEMDRAKVLLHGS